MYTGVCVCSCTLLLACFAMCVLTNSYHVSTCALVCVEGLHLVLRLRVLEAIEELQKITKHHPSICSVSRGIIVSTIITLVGKHMRFYQQIDPNV